MISNMNDNLHFLHREIFGCEVHLKMVENDLAGASRVLKVRRIATQQYDNAAEVLKQALGDKKEKDIKKQRRRRRRRRSSRRAIKEGSENLILLNCDKYYEKSMRK